MATIKDDLKTKLAREVLDAALTKGFLRDWLATLGEAGAPAQKGKSVYPPSTRVQAARSGIDLVTKFLGDAGASAAGNDLLEELSKMGSLSEEIDSEVQSVETEE